MQREECNTARAWNGGTQIEVFIGLYIIVLGNKIIVEPTKMEPQELV